MKKLGITFIVAAVLSISFVGQASALPEFKKAFSEKYINDESSDEFKAAVKKAGCNICHIKGEDKDQQNAYGLALAELIEGNAKERKDAKKKGSKEEKDAIKAEILSELNDAWDKAAEAKNADGETFGSRIEAGELPVPLPAGGDDDDDK